MIRRLIHVSTRNLFAAVVAAPLLLYGLYLAFIASDRYVSESIITVRQSGGDGGSVAGTALLLAGITPASHEDTLYLKDYIHSQGLLNTLDKRLQLRNHFGGAGLDWPFRLDPDADRETFTRYYRQRVEIGFDEKSGLLKVRTQGFTADFAQQLNQAVLEESERFVNENSHRIARERMKFAEGELSLAGQRLQLARDDLLTFQNKHRLLDPSAQALSTGALTAELQASRSRLEAELTGLLTYLKDDAYQVNTLRARLAALDKQIAAERDRATSRNRDGERLNALAADFQALQLKTQFAQDAYKLALAAVENSRIEATRKLKNVVTVEPPTRPDSAEYPLHAYNLLTLLTLCLLLFAILRLVFAIIREHQD